MNDPLDALFITSEQAQAMYASGELVHPRRHRRVWRRSEGRLYSVNARFENEHAAEWFLNLSPRERGQVIEAIYPIGKPK